MLPECWGLIGFTMARLVLSQDTPGKETGALCVHLSGCDDLLCFPATIFFLGLSPVPRVL